MEMLDYLEARWVRSTKSEGICKTDQYIDDNVYELEVWNTYVCVIRVGLDSFLKHLNPFRGSFTTIGNFQRLNLLVRF